MIHITHSDLIPLLVSYTLPFFDEICKRSARFIYCHVSSQNLLLFVLLSDTVFLSVVVILLLIEMSCSRFKWQFNDFVCGNVSLNNYEFLHNFYSRVGNDDWSAAQLLEEILRRDSSYQGR